MSRVVLFGTTSLAEVAWFYLTNDSAHEVVAFTAHEAYIDRERIFGLPVVPFERVADTYPPDDFEMFVAVGYKDTNRFRAGVYEEAKRMGYGLISYVSSRMVAWGDTAIGDNCFILENQTIQPFVEIGNNVVMWSGNHIGHHVKVADHCFITSHVVISGNVTVGPYCFLGVNSTIRDNVTIAPECVIGAGALILSDTVAGGVYKAAQTEPSFIDHTKLKGF